jgi:hypothetical protein
MCHPHADHSSCLSHSSPTRIYFIFCIHIPLLSIANIHILEVPVSNLGPDWYFCCSSFTNKWILDRIGNAGFAYWWLRKVLFLGTQMFYSHWKEVDILKKLVPPKHQLFLARVHRVLYPRRQNSSDTCIILKNGQITTGIFFHFICYLQFTVVWCLGFTLLKHCFC